MKLAIVHRRPDKDIRVHFWVIALAPFGALLLVLWPKFLFRFIGMNGRFDAPEWMKWRVS